MMSIAKSAVNWSFKNVARGYRYLNRKRFGFVQNQYMGNEMPNRRALLYYKTDPYFDKRSINRYAHTNYWEIVEIVRILNSLGYVVDIIDRNVEDFTPEDIYTLFLGLGAGNSARHFVRYAQSMPSAYKVVYAAGPDPYLANEKVLERYKFFNSRNNSSVLAMRTVSDIDFAQIAIHSDAIFCIGEDFSVDSYKKYNKSLFPIYPSSSPSIVFDIDYLRTRDRNKYLCFAGSGFICKGVDLLVEAFEKLPDHELFICGPDSEKAFFDIYGDTLRRSENIHYLGFVEVGSNLFTDLCKKCSYVIFNSAAEGVATSVTTCMRAGLVPILNYESGVKRSDIFMELEFGPYAMQQIIDVVMEASAVGEVEYCDLALKAVDSSKNYSQAGFTLSLTSALMDCEKRFIGRWGNG